MTAGQMAQTRASSASTRKSPGWRDADVLSTSVDEANLLVRLRAGDEEVFRALVSDLTPALIRLARSYTQTDADAQDAVQDTWLVVIDRLGTFTSRSSFRTWVCGILVHTARRSGVQSSRCLPFSSVWNDEHGPAVDPARFYPRNERAPRGSWSMPPQRWDQIPEDILAGQELSRVINAAIAALPSRQRELIIARDVVGMEAAEAALILGLSSGNQRVLLHRARSRVRTALEEHGTRVLAAHEARRPTDVGIASRLDRR